jgi:hypothetical protein
MDALSTPEGRRAAGTNVAGALIWLNAAAARAAYERPSECERRMSA